MATKSSPPKASKILSQAEMGAALPKLERRLEELRALDLRTLTEESGRDVLDAHSQKINAALRSIYGADTLEYDEYSIRTFKPEFSVWYSGMDTSLRGNLETVKTKVSAGIRMLATLVEMLREELEPTEQETGSRAMRAYAGLDLHPEINRPASKLYTDGHFANAVEASVKALNGLVRLRGGVELDGTALMEKTFSPNNPVLRFNAMENQSDKDEQKGFMQLFSGAVSGLRNPRAHGFIEDDPERALEFIAFVSLLAKLLDGAEAG